MVLVVWSPLNVHGADGKDVQLAYICMFDICGLNIKYSPSNKNNISA